MPKRTTLPPVSHDSTSELVYCIRGRLTVILGSRRYALRPGHVVWIPPKTWHAFISTTTEVECLSIFSPALDLNNKPDVRVKNSTVSLR